MENNELCKIALRLYLNKGFWQQKLVEYILTGQNLGNIERFLPCEVKKDTPTIQGLAKNYGGLYVDLFSNSEIQAMRHNFLPDREHRRIAERLSNPVLVNECLQIASNFDHNIEVKRQYADMLELAKIAKLRNIGAT